MMMLSVSLIFSVFSYLDFLFFPWFLIFCLYNFFLFNVIYFDGIFCVDFLGITILFITVWVFLFSMVNFFSHSSGVYVFSPMLFLLFFSFLCADCVYFYVFFEACFLFMFVFLMGWGLTYERFQASFYMFFYTLMFSLPFFVFLMNLSYSTNFTFFSSFGFFNFYDYLMVFSFLVFSVKLPLFGFHLWLPKAHVESPVSGSMVLAGVLLKLGGYGLVRFMPLIKTYYTLNIGFLNFLFYLSLWGCLFSCLVCARQIDLKLIIAYSSVVHMSLMVLGIFLMTSWGFYGCVLSMISHGFVSPLLFYLMGFIYSVNHSRSLMVLKSGLLFIPVFCGVWFLCCSLNMSLPPFMSFYGEVTVIGSLLFFLSFFDMVVLFFSILFVGLYCVYMYISVSHGGLVLSVSYSFNLFHFLISFCHCFYVIFYPLVFFLS